MGFKLFSPSDSPTPPEPQANLYETIRTVEIEEWTVALVHYMGCTNYGGYKLMVFDVPTATVQKQKLLDPHFLQFQDQLSPVARFEPTERGQQLAELLCRNRFDGGV